MKSRLRYIDLWHRHSGPTAMRRGRFTLALVMGAEIVGAAISGNPVVTYTLESESGVSLCGAGWKPAAKASPETWNRPVSGRDRTERVIYSQRKIR